MYARLKQPYWLPVVHEAKGYGQKSFKLVWRCLQLLSEFLAKGHLPRVTSVTPVANDKGDNEMIPRAVHRSPALQLRKTPENLS